MRIRLWIMVFWSAACFGLGYLAVDEARKEVWDDAMKRLDAIKAEGISIGFRDAIEKAANKVQGLDHCDIAGHSCTQEIAEEIRSLTPDSEGKAGK